MIDKELPNQYLSLIITDGGDGKEGRYGVHLKISDSLSPIEMVDMLMLAVQSLGSAVPTLREILATADPQAEVK